MLQETFTAALSKAQPVILLTQTETKSLNLPPRPEIQHGLIRRETRSSLRRSHLLHPTHSPTQPKQERPTFISISRPALPFKTISVATYPTPTPARACPPVWPCPTVPHTVSYTNRPTEHTHLQPSRAAYTPSHFQQEEPTRTPTLVEPMGSTVPELRDRQPP